MRLETTFGLGMLAAAMLDLAGCGPAEETTDEDSGEELTVEDENGKADAITAAVKVKGSLPTNGKLSDRTLSAGQTWGYKFTAAAKEGVFEWGFFKPTSSAIKPLIYIYGPVSGTSAGRRLASWVASGDNTFGEVKFIAPKAGTYLLVVAEKSKKALKFNVESGRIKEACKEAACKSDVTGGPITGASCAGDGTTARPHHVCECTDGKPVAAMQLCGTNAEHAWCEEVEFETHTALCKGEAG